MKINYATLKTFDEKKLIEGFHIFLANAEKLSQSGDVLAETKDYGLATVLKILSIEEAVKALHIFLVWAGLDKEDHINSAFKGAGKGFESVHKNRLMLAAFNSKAHSILAPELEGKMLEHVIKKMEQAKAEGLNDIGRVIGEIIKTLPAKGDLLDVANIEAEMSSLQDEKDSWLFNAQSTKEECLYAGLDDYHQWINPQETKEDTFIKAKSESAEFLGLVIKVKEMLSSPLCNRSLFNELLRCYS